MSSSFALSLNDSSFVNMVMITPISPPTQRVSKMDITFTPLDKLYKEDPYPLYIQILINGASIRGVLIDPTCWMDLIIEEVLFINILNHV